MTAATLEFDEDHLPLYPRCGICADIVFTGERVVALVGNRNSTSYLGRTGPFDFPERGYTSEKVDGRRLCRFPDCKHCAASPEVAPVHFDCFEIFQQRCSLNNTSGASDRLWILAAWTNPWRGAYPIHFSVPMTGSPFLKTICAKARLPRLCTLPPELLEMIWQYSTHSLLWRCVSVLELADVVSAMKPQPLLEVPLRELLSWERGGKFERLGESLSLPTLRLTIDSAGISKVERLPVPPLYAGESTGLFYVIVQGESSVSRVMAQLKDGRLRLALPGLSPPLIWNTPAPPNLSHCKAYPEELTSCRIIHTVEMDGISGITFFFASGQLFGIHIHRSKESCAMDTFTRNLTDRLQAVVVWIYLPISRPDRILALGIRKGPSALNILIKTALIGDIVVGSPSNAEGHVTNKRLAASAPSTIVYGVPREGCPVPYFGALCGPSNQTCGPIRLIKRGACPISRAYFSWAPLCDVSSALVFYDQDKEICRGILFHYQNRGSRAAGQCRLHVDPAECVTRPVQLCFRRNEGIYKVEVRFKQDLREDIKGWESRPMKGLVKFWFTRESSFLVFED